MKFKKGDIVILAREENQEYDGEIGLVFTIEETFPKKESDAYSATHLNYWYEEKDLEFAPPVLVELYEGTKSYYFWEEEEE